MEIRQLKYFIAVAEERNISRAAARLHLSQPPLTRQIQALEEQMGVALFKRTPWGVELTDAGRTFLEHARHIASSMELASEQARRAGKGQIGRIDIGVFGSAMLSIVPQILNSFSASHPGVELALHSAAKGPQIEALHRGRIMIAFDRYLPETPELCVETVCAEAVYVALNTRHPLAAQEQVGVEQLRNELLIGEQDSSVFTATRALFLHHGFEPHTLQKAADMISAAVMVAGGFGTALVPDSVRSLQLPNVVYRPLAGEVEARVLLHCAYRRDESSPLLAALLDTVRAFRAQHAAGMPS
ncbi:LysR substrate-binding domain-containing protein [Uliginosibacterium sp. 31-16]|uniref:LysR substrate-binding domain-containing protein n=1 Tax=Uliginosibacterium sp. 31-16 TaxID=3068315 RepID=UPI00273F4EFA|nr:LysR substrate-binding domain-containing protein [Uliginosibacterium sp. 31-16]MDP5238762.1 LysR substrate-binding domain-containing protein [Uliginosibacterium sp. 31-16]